MAPMFPIPVGSRHAPMRAGFVIPYRGPLVRVGERKGWVRKRGLTSVYERGIIKTVGRGIIRHARG